MIKAFLLGAGLVLAGCQSATVPEAPKRGDLSDEVVRSKTNGPPKGPEGACWQADLKPAVIETVTEQIMVSPEVLAEDGTVISPATFRTNTSQRMIEDRETVWFRAPCPAEMTEEFIATLQRALKARGFYLLPLTGRMDAPTRAAVRQFQAQRGLDSDHLSLAAARELGIIATALDQL